MSQVKTENQQSLPASAMREKPLIKDQSLPDDPRCWSREDVAQWIRTTANRHSLPSIPAERFLMNGKALCLMNMEMFVQRVPLGGKLLYKDFQIRLHQAMYRYKR